MFNNKPSVAHSKPTVTLKADTGTTNHYIQPTEHTFLRQVQHSKHPVQVHLPNHTIRCNEKDGLLSIPTINAQAQRANILPALTNLSLLLIGQLCDNDCIAIFSKKYMFIRKNGTIILQGRRNLMDNLWDVPFDNTQHNNLNMITQNKTSYKLANFLHACVGSPTIRTFQSEIKSNFFL